PRGRWQGATRPRSTTQGRGGRAPRAWWDVAARRGDVTRAARDRMVSRRSRFWFNGVMHIGLYSFAEIASTDPTHVAQRLRDLVEEIELADQVGLDVFGVGEHHRQDYAVSSPAVVLAAAAERTKRIRLSSAVSVLSSDDPVRVFQDFATLDLLSGG